MSVSDHVISRRVRFHEGQKRAAHASLEAQRCAELFCTFTADRAACIRLAQQHGLKRGIVELENSLSKLYECCKILQARFPGINATANCTGSNQDQDNKASHQHSLTAAAGRAPAANGVWGSTLFSTQTGSSQLATAPPPPAPPPAAPRPLPPGSVLPFRPTAGAAAASVTTWVPRSSEPAAAPAPPPGPLPPHKSSSVPQQQQHLPSRAPPPLPPPPPPPPPGFGKLAKPAIASTAGCSGSTPRALPAAVQAASPAASQPGRPAPQPPLPPPPPPPAAALRSIGPSGAAVSPARPARTSLPPPPPPPPPLSSRGVSKRPAVVAAPAGISALAAVAAATAAAAASSRAAAADAHGPGVAQDARNSGSIAAEPATPDTSSNYALPGILPEGASKLKRLHVDPVPRHRLADGTFWTVALDSVATPFKDNMVYALHAMFSEGTIKRQRRHTDSSPRGHSTDTTTSDRGPYGTDGMDGTALPSEGIVVMCVPEKRALHVEVVLKRLRISADKLAAAINTLDIEKLKPDDLAAIRSILPKPEELADLKKAKADAEKKWQAMAGGTAAMQSPRTPSGSLTEPTSGSTGNSSTKEVSRHSRSSSMCESISSASTGSGLTGPRLGVVEAAFEALGKVEQLQAKMRAMEFSYDVEAVKKVVFEFADDIGDALDALRDSGQLQTLLAFVRDLANTMNPERGLGGLKLESLTRLQSIRMHGATDLNLLHYIVAHLAAVLPSVLDTDAEREVFRVACRRGTFDAVNARVRTLKEVQKRLTTDLARAEEAAQQQQLQPGTSADSPKEVVGAAAGGSDGAAAGTHAMYVARLQGLLDAAAPVVQQVQQNLDDIIKKFRWTAEYYCEDVKQTWKLQPVAFLTHFLELLDSIASTRKDEGRLKRVDAVLQQFVELQQELQQQQLQEHGKQQQEDVLTEHLLQQWEHRVQLKQLQLEGLIEADAGRQSADETVHIQEQQQQGRGQQRPHVPLLPLRDHGKLQQQAAEVSWGSERSDAASDAESTSSSPGDISSRSVSPGPPAGQQQMGSFRQPVCNHVADEAGTPETSSSVPVDPQDTKAQQEANRPDGTKNSCNALQGALANDVIHDSSAAASKSSGRDTVNAEVAANGAAESASDAAFDADNATSTYSAAAGGPPIASMRQHQQHEQEWQQGLRQHRHQQYQQQQPLKAHVQQTKHAGHHQKHAPARRDLAQHSRVAKAAAATGSNSTWRTRPRSRSASPPKLRSPQQQRLESLRLRGKPSPIMLQQQQQEAADNKASDSTLVTYPDDCHVGGPNDLHNHNNGAVATASPDLLRQLLQESIDSDDWTNSV